MYPSKFQFCIVFLLLFDGFCQSDGKQVQAVWPAYNLPVDYASMSSKYCPDAQLDGVDLMSCCSDCPPGMQQEDCQLHEFCYRNPNSSLFSSHFDRFGRCCPRPKPLDELCPFGEPLLYGKYCCGKCGWQVAENLMGRCPSGFVCLTYLMERHHSVCCPESPQKYTISRCEGSWLGFVIHNGFIYESMDFDDHMKPGLLLDHNNKAITSVCCRQAGSTGPYGMMVSGPYLQSGIYSKCLKDQAAQSILSFEALNDHIKKLYDKGQPAYVIETNRDDDNTPGFSFPINPRFHSNANWIWAVQNQTEFVHPGDRLTSDECIWCQIEMQDKSEVRELVGVYKSEDLKTLGEFVEVYGLSDSVQFKLYIDVFSSSSDCKGLSLEIIPMGNVDGDKVIIFDLDITEDRANIKFCHKARNSANECSKKFAIERKSLTLCGQYQLFWITIRGSLIQCGLNFGSSDSENILSNWTGWSDNKFQRLGHLKLIKASGMRFFRSSSENRCLFTPKEADDLIPCGDGYIIDEKTCQQCGCCYYPHLFPNRIYANSVPCYQSLSTGKVTKESAGRSNDSHCQRLFEKVIGHFEVSIENNRTFMLNESISVKVFIKNTIRNIRLKVFSANSVIADNMTLTPTKKVTEKDGYSFSGSLLVQFNHSGLHILTAEVIGKGEDKLKKEVTVNVGKISDIVAAELDSCSSSPNLALFAVTMKGFNSSIMRASLDFGDGLMLNKIDVSQMVNRPSWTVSSIADKIVLLEHTYASVNPYTATLMVSSSNRGSSITVKKKVFEKLCHQNFSSFGQIVVFDSGFDQDYTLQDDISLRVYVKDGVLTGHKFRIHWFCSKDSSWKFSAHDPNDVIPPESVRCFQDLIWLDNVAQQNESYPESLLVFSAQELNFWDIPQSFYFHIVITKAGHHFITSTESGKISLIRGSAPDISIICHGNCGRNFNPSEAMLLYCMCHDCFPGENLSLSWKVMSNSEGNQMTDVHLDTFAYSLYYVINGNAIRDITIENDEAVNATNIENTYTVQLAATRLDGATGYATYIFSKKHQMKLDLRHAKKYDEETIYVYKDYLALLSIPIALMLGVVIGVLVRRKRGKVAHKGDSKESISMIDTADSGDNELNAVDVGEEVH